MESLEDARSGKAGSSARPRKRRRVSSAPRASALVHERDRREPLQRLGDEGLGCERRRIGRADAPAISPIEHDQVRAHPSWSLVADGHELPGAQRLVSGDGRPGVVEERPFLHLVAPEGRPEAEADRPRVLVVDDDAGTRALCSVILKLSALAVIEAADGRGGLVQARLQRPHLIVTDVMMPGLNGFQLAEALDADERTRAIPVIFMSGQSESRSRALELGAAAYVTKPFNPVSFAAIVARVLANGRSATGARGSDTAEEET